MFVKREKSLSRPETQSSQVGSTTLPCSEEEVTKHTFLTDKGRALAAIDRMGCSPWTLKARNIITKARCPSHLVPQGCEKGFYESRSSHSSMPCKGVARALNSTYKCADLTWCLAQGIPIVGQVTLILTLACSFWGALRLIDAFSTSKASIATADRVTCNFPLHTTWKCRLGRHRQEFNAETITH